MTRTKIRSRSQVVIIGTGAGGASLGYSLAKAGIAVTWLEEGVSHSPPGATESASAAVHRLYRNRGLTIAYGSPMIPIPLGKGVGGTTTINSATCFRPPAEVLHHWTDDLGLGNCSLESLTPFLEQIENFLGVAPAPIHLLPESSRRVMKWLQGAGHDAQPVLRNAPQCRGCGNCCYGCDIGAKSSADQSWIPEGIRLGAKLRSRVRALSVKMSGNRAMGVLARVRRRDGKLTEEFFPADHVVVACGTLQTPGLLRRSGFRHFPHLGRHLTIHPASKVYFKFDKPVHSWKGIPQGFYSKALHADGVLIEGVFMPKDIAASMNPFTGQELHEFMKGYDHIGTCGFMMEDSTTGTVHASDWVSYQMTQKDADRHQKTTVFLADLALKNGVREIIPMVHSSVPRIRNHDDLARFKALRLKPSQLEMAAFHPLGTARMGQSPLHGVVDENLRVIGTENLSICDGSILPSSLGVNPQMTIMAFGLRLADLFKSVN